MALRLGWFSTGRDQAAIDLFNIIYEAIADGTIDATMAFVFVNRVEGEAIVGDDFLKTVRATGIPMVSVSSDAFEPKKHAAGRQDPAVLEEWRLDYDRQVQHTLGGYDADLIILAGYMLIVGPELCTRYTMINLHPALPDGPTGSWQQVIHSLIDAKAPETGAMMHLVTPELDRGPAISFFKIPVRGGFDDIRRDGVIRELPLILMTVKEFADGRLSVRDRKVFADSVELKAGYDLSAAVNAWLAEHSQAGRIKQ